MAYCVLEQNYFVLLRIFYCLVAFGFASAAFLDDQPYCALRYRRLCQGKGRHVGCQYPYPGPGVGCHNYTQIKFSPKMQHFILNYINRRRQKIAAGSERARGGALIPKPQVMMMVVWDRELALLAQRLADQCSFAHDACRATVRYPYSGQTVGEVRWRGDSQATGAQRAIRRVLDAWWGERRRARPAQLLAPFKLANRTSAWGHFSQLAVWALSAAGCGATRHGSPRRLLLVCDYSHTNMLGQSTLVAGDLAPCPANTARRPRSAYPLLCAPVPTQHSSGNEEDLDYESYDYAPSFTDLEDYVASDEPMTEAALLHYAKGSDTERIPGRSRVTSTKPSMIDQLEQELFALTSPRASSKELSTSVPTYFDTIRDGQVKEFGLKGRARLNKVFPHSQFTELITTESSRQRWKHSRERPRRPGADALVNTPFKTLDKGSPVTSFSLDREGLEQLFQDTGFHKDWKESPQ